MFEGKRMLNALIYACNKYMNTTEDLACHKIIRCVNVTGLKEVLESGYSQSNANEQRKLVRPH